MKREDFISKPVTQIKLKPGMTVNQLIQEFDKSGCFGAGRLSTACDILEKMIRDDECTIYLGLAGAMVPAGLRTVIADLISKRFVDVLVSTGANMVHDLIEAFGEHHYKGHWFVDDFMLYKYHIYRIYDVFVPEESFVKTDKKIAEMFDEIAMQKRGMLSTRELAREIGKRIDDETSILRAAYNANVPVFLPAIRDSEFGYIYWFHAKRQATGENLMIDSFKEILEFADIASQSKRIGMVIIGGGVPRNTIQHIAVTVRKALDYAIIITMDRPETGGLSGSTLEETISWGKVKEEADKVTVPSDAMIAFPIMVASVLERLGKDFVRRIKPH